jgi:hypothetical protein
MPPACIRFVKSCAALALLVFLGVHPAIAQTPSLAATAPSAPPALGPPPGLHPLSPALAERMDELVRATEEYRGLHLKRPVAAAALDEQEMERLLETAQKESSAELRALAVSLQAFGLIPEGVDAGKMYRNLLTRQIVAFYDPERKYLAMVERKGNEGAELTAVLSKLLGPELARRAEAGILVHELTHALDDQHFDLGKVSKVDRLGDGSAAFLGLVEGDATLTMTDYILGKRIESIPGVGQVMSAVMRDSGELATFSPELAANAGLADAPAWLRDTLIFSYVQGFAFCLDVERVGGQKLLDYAFAQDPPRSTEQILHPEKWYGHRDDPIVLAWPDLTAALPGFNKVAEGQMGEEGIAILLREGLREPKLAKGAGASTAASVAAAGWGGDRVAVYEKEGNRALLWLTEWDTPADAAEFQAAAVKLARKSAGWKVVRSAPTRVVLTRGIDGIGGMQAGVEAALAAVPAERPANRGIDFAALQITPKLAVAEKDAADPAAKTAVELGADGHTYTDAEHGFSLQVPGKDWVLSRPNDGEHLLRIAGPGKVLISISEREMGSALPLERLGKAIAESMKKRHSDLMSDVTILRSERIERGAREWYELQSEVTSREKRLHSVDRLSGRDNDLVTARADVLAELWPANEAAILAVLDSITFFRVPPDAEVQSHLSSDGRTYSNPELGFSIRLPQSEPGWVWGRKRHGAPVLLESPDGKVKLTVVPLLLPAPSLAATGRMDEENEATEPGSHTLLHSGLVRKDGRELYEIERESESKGTKLRESKRFYPSANGILAVSALGLADEWPLHERAIREALDSFVLTAGPATPPEPPH